jgi:hypothetical protein
MFEKGLRFRPWRGKLFCKKFGTVNQLYFFETIMENANHGMLSEKLALESMMCSNQVSLVELHSHRYIYI